VTSFGEGPHHLFSRLGYFFPTFIGEFDNIFVSFVHSVIKYCSKVKAVTGDT
jgi:hypothetical protein